MSNKLLYSCLKLSALFLFLSCTLNPAEAQQRGYIMSRTCPFSCRTEGINKSHCRDWREGNVCYVEDLNRAPNREPPRAPQAPGYEPWPSNNGNDSGRNDCRSGGYIPAPRVNIYKTKPTGNFFGDKYKVRGEVEGVCLSEAGYFASGRKRQNIPVVTTRDFRRFEFELKVDLSDRPEIRVYNSNGESDYVVIDDREAGGNGNGFGW